MAEKLAVAAVVALVVLVIYAVYKYRNSGPAPCYVWDSYNPANKGLPWGVLGSIGKTMPVGAKGPDGKWHLGGTITDPMNPDWGKIGVPPNEGYAFTATEIWYLRMKDLTAPVCPFRAVAAGDKQVMFNGIPVCYGTAGIFGGVFGAGVNGACPPASATYSDFAPLADAISGS